MSRRVPRNDLEVLLSAEQIASRVKELAAQISADYRGRPLHLIGMLKGAWVFLADLVRHLDLEVTVDFLSIASYGNDSYSSGVVRITKDLDQSIEGLDVLVVEDILDTGHTFEYLRGVLEAHKPKSLKVVLARQVLTARPAGRGRLRGLHHPRRFRGGLWAGLQPAVSQSAGYPRFATRALKASGHQPSAFSQGFLADR